MKILLTGSSGFIGARLLEKLLSDGHSVLVTTRAPREERPGILWLLGDLSNLNKMSGEIEKFEPEAILHLAWEGIPDFSEEQCRKNVFLSINFLAMVGKIPSVRKVIVTGSCWEYGNRNGACSELDTTNPSNWFTWAKDTVQKYVKRLCEDQNIEWYWGRVFFVYGQNQRSQSLIPSVIRALENNEVPDLRSPYAKNDFIFVEDLIQGLVSCLKEGPPSGIYNFGSGIESTVIDIVRVLENLISGKIKLTDQIEVKPSVSPEALKSFYANTEISRAVLGWEATTSISEGMQTVLKDNGS